MDGRAGPVLEELLSSGRYPAFAATFTGSDFDLDLDELFESGLQWLLDGISSQQAAQQASLRRRS